ncbi:hypothetical protein V8D89_011189 [Ganoderma adspersum]
MRLILSACSRLSSVRLQSQPRLVSRRGALLRRHFHIQTDDSESPSGTSRALEAAFNGPDEYHPPIFDQVHHSFTPGEVFEFGDDEYRIERKLRHRLLSRVWLATHTNKRDPVPRDRRFVAFETFDDMFSSRLSINPESNGDLHYVRDFKVQQDEGATGSEYCDRALRVYLGPHLCVVKEPCGPTLAALQEMQPHGSFALPTAKRIVKQTLLALDFLHTTMERTRWGLLYPTGVSAHNIQVALLGPKGVLAARIQDDLDANPPHMVYRFFWDIFRWWAPEESTKVLYARPLPPFGLSPSLDNLETRLSRCEYATWDQHQEMLAERAASSSDPDEQSTFRPYNEFHAPLRLAAPEAIRGSPHPFSPPINICAVGHLLFQCLTGSELVLASCIDAECAGPDFPHFDEVNSLCDPHALEERLRNFAHVNEEMGHEDMQATCAVLARCFEFDPAKRPTARQLLEDGWFQS